MLEVTILTHGGGEAGAALGAARLGWLADGGDARQVLNKPAVRARYLPDPARQALLAPRFERYRALYRHLRPLFTPARETP
jgi:xylulokinase